MSPSFLTPVVLLALAAGAARSAPPDPTLPATPVPVLSHRSAFADFRSLTDAKPIPWRQANDQAAAIGGWRAYAREAARPEPAAAPASAVPSSRGKP
jgi:hypothetical protein